MSQTLSLEPGKYILFITPPVAGVDFTGTPTPSVSYQWRKNGTAISGQTAATITGVWVEQSGGTVDLVDGDTISIDIILTNPVQVTTKTVAAVIDASIPAPVISPISIRLVSEPTTPVSSIPNASIGSQIMVASTGSVNVVTTPPLLPTYQWRRGFAPIAGATSQTYTLQAADADSIIDCVVAATNSGGTTTRTAAATVGTLPAAGWTELTPSADSRLIYVATDGDDVAAANVHGRGYYLPSDPEIGADPTNPVGPIVAYKSLWRAETRLRRTTYLYQSGTTDVYGGWSRWIQLNAIGQSHRGFPDWLLLQRGDTFGYSTEGRSGCGDLPYATNVCSDSALWLRGQNGGLLRGRSESEPIVITAWGNPALERPVRANISISGHTTNMRVVSIQFTGDIYLGTSIDNYHAEDILIEDCRMRQGGYANIGSYVNCKMRRCVISGGYNPNAHNQGMFLANIDTNVGVYPTDSWLIEECVFDRNGYKENPFDATKWTAGVVSPLDGQQYAPGLGAQPLRTYFDRNIYVATEHTENKAQITLRGNIFSRNGGGGSVQMRQGGVVDRNLFMWNEDAGFVQGGLGGLYKDNVILHDDHMLPPGGWGKAIGMWNSNFNSNSNPLYVMDGNVAAHFHRSSNGPGGFFSGIFTYRTPEEEEANVEYGSQRNGTVKILNNTLYRNETTRGLSIEFTSAPMVEIAGNEIAVLSGTVIQGAIAANATAGGMPYDIDGNLYHSQSATPFGGNRTFAQWQALRSDLDDSSSFLSDFVAFKAAAGWTAPERDIVSYMQSVDPTYVVNEDVYIDEDADIKQADRQKVWEVMASSGGGAMSEVQAKLTARRYHAFVTFIQRAKENRKGAWDSRWTAEAVNNYIREGFGKPPVTGPYDSRPIAERLLDYTT